MISPPYLSVELESNECVDISKSRCTTALRDTCDKNTNNTDVIFNNNSINNDSILTKSSVGGRDIKYIVALTMEKLPNSNKLSAVTDKDGTSGDEESSSSSTYSTAEENHFDEDTDSSTEVDNIPVQAVEAVANNMSENDSQDSATQDQNINNDFNIRKPERPDEVVQSAKHQDCNQSQTAIITERRSITVTELQTILDCFKASNLSASECEKLVDLLGVSQSRNDFQWALHQLGGFNALLFLYARVVEICPDDEVQSKGLSLVLGQLKNHSKITDAPPKSQYNLLRFVLNSAKSAFGFKTFIILVNHCLTPSGHKLLDYELLDTCLLSSWRSLVSTRCTEADAPAGRRSLFECLLAVTLDLLLEKNIHRDLNVAILKSKNFGETLLSICYNAVFDNQTSSGGPALNMMDALRISSLVKSIFSELMAPPDAYIAVCLIKFGLYPLLPRDLPPLPRKEDAFFVFQNRNITAINLNNVAEAEEISEDEIIMESKKTCSQYSCVNNEDIPEIVGHGNNLLNQEKSYNKVTFESKQIDNFRETFQDSLIESLMSILLNSLAILPDCAFQSVLHPHLNSHILVAYCSHPNQTLKELALKLLSAYLSRVKNPCITEFLKNKGFFLTSLYLQGNPDIANLVTSICKGFGPVAYPLIVGLLYSNTVVNGIIDWIEEDEVGVIPALLSVGFLPSVINLHRTSANLPRPLNNLVSLVIRYCVLNPKEDPWKVLFCPALECSPQGSYLIGRIYQEATEYLRLYNRKELKKGDTSSRILWLMERGSVSRFGSYFDKWLLNTFTLHVMEMDDSEETETWRYFVKKNRKRLHYLIGVFLCRIFAPNKGDVDFKQHTLRVLITSCPNLYAWIPKVIKCDEQIERCFTAFIRIFLCDAGQRSGVKSEPELRSASFQSLICNNGNLTLTFQMAAENGESSEIMLSDKVIRAKFEDILVKTGVLSPTNNFSNFSADFKNFKILLERPPVSGVSYHELRQCLTSVEKMRNQLNKNLNVSAAILKQNTAAAKNNFSNAAYFDGVFDAVMAFAMEVVDNVTRMRTRQEIEVARKVSFREDDVFARGKWWKVVEQMVHPKAPWYFKDAYPKFWALDQSEGPGRVRIRLKLQQLKVHNRFVTSKYRKSAKCDHQPLEYLFYTESDEVMSFPVIQSEIQFMRFCTRILPGEELCGEIILSADTLYFIPEVDQCQNENVDVPISSIVHILRRRYALEDRAAEIFVESRSFLFVFRTQKDREEFVHLLTIKHPTNSLNSSLMDSSLPSMTSQWLKGQISNFEYLMYLNTAAGRTYCDLMQYPVFPFVLAKYDSHTLDLHAPQSYRDLKKPMAIQDPSKEEHFVATYNYLKRECDSAPFHYGSHYSNSGIVLHFLVRLPPYTQHFLKYQDGSFDIPDRSFHSVETTWRLASRESNTDFKEAIPEFFYLPEFLQNLQHFDLGVRQNGLRVDNVVLPPWAKGDPRLFTLVNRQALESNQVRKFLSDWIDLIFGFKQTGKAAVQAINVFHPSTYEGFEVDGPGDELLRRARKAMVSTYGQTPKKLFPYPHSRSSLNPVEKCDYEVLDTVWGIRWGNFLGSPSCPQLEVINTREYEDSVALFETQSRVVFWPEHTLIMGDNVVGNWDASGIRIKTSIIYLCIGDEITVCVSTDDSIWVGHQSGRIAVLKLSSGLDKVIETVDVVGHYKPIKSIDLNQDFSTAISCSGENYALVWDMNRISFGNTIESKEDIDDVYSSRSTGDVILLNRATNKLTMTTINGFHIGEVQPEDKIESACISGLDPGWNVNLLAVGCDFGIIRFYSTWDLKFINQIKVMPLATLAINSIRYSRDGRRLYCMSRTEAASVTVALQLPESSKYP